MRIAVDEARMFAQFQMTNLNQIFDRSEVDILPALRKSVLTSGIALTINQNLNRRAMAMCNTLTIAIVLFLNRECSDSKRHRVFHDARSRQSMPH